jgi:hypothetical protein
VVKARPPIIAAALVLVGAVAVFRLRSPSQLADKDPVVEGTVAPRGSHSARSAVAGRQQQQLPAAGVRAEPATPLVQLGASQEVATVNGTAITGRQLLAWRARDPAELEMTGEMFASLRSRAIERELTFEEARGKGVELSAAQLAQLKEVRKNAEARGETDPAQLDFEEADARAHMLATALLEKAGVSAPFATEADVKRYYEMNPAEFDELPNAPAARDAAWRKIAIDIRQTLALELQEKYQQRVRAYFDQLRAGAHITN